MILEEKISCFSKELNQINDEKVREFVKLMLAGTGDWFYHDPASTSGKYHPMFALGDGGLVRHTRAVVYWVIEIARSELFNVNAHQTDLLIAAAIMHDIRKHTADGGYIMKHAREACNMILEEQTKHSDLLSAEDAKYIADAVSTHMGIWGVRDGERKPTSDSEKLLHLADLMASRRESFLNIFGDQDSQECPKMPSLSMVGEPQNINEHKQEETIDEDDDENDKYINTFGKKFPESVAEVYQLDPEYIRLITGIIDFFDKEVQKVVRKFMKKKQ